MTAWLKRIDLETFESERLALPEGGEVSVGRTKQNTISVSATKVSRVHCVLVREPDGWRVEDSELLERYLGEWASHDEDPARTR